MHSAHTHTHTHKHTNTHTHTNTNTHTHKHKHTHTHTYCLKESCSVCCTFDNLAKCALNLYLFMLQNKEGQLMLSLFEVLLDNLTYTTVQQVSLYSERQALTSFIIYSLTVIHSEGRTC